MPMALPLSTYYSVALCCGNTPTCVCVYVCVRDRERDKERWMVLMVLCGIEYMVKDHLYERGILLSSLHGLFFLINNNG